MDKSCEELSALAASARAGELCSSSRADQLAMEVAQLRQAMADQQAAPDQQRSTDESLANLQPHAEGCLERIREELISHTEASCEKLSKHLADETVRHSSAISDLRTICNEQGERIARELELVAGRVEEMRMEGRGMDQRLTEMERRAERPAALEVGGHRVVSSRTASELESKVAELDKKLEAFKTVVIKVSA